MASGNTSILLLEDDLKLSNEIQFSISPDKPMRISYDLGDESSVVFFIAPKVV